MPSLRTRNLFPPTPRPFLKTLPTEMRVKIYRHLFSELSARQRPPVLEYHCCDKTYEVTRRFQRMIGQPSVPRLTPILRTCKAVYDEALPFLYQQAMMVVTLRAAPYSLDLSRGIAKKLRLVGSLELIISSSFPCVFPPHPEGNDAPKVVTRPRRASWNGQSSSRAYNTVTKSPKPSIPAWTRKQYWQSFMSPEQHHEAYKRRLDTLLGGLSNGRNLKRFDVVIENMEYRMDARSVVGVLRLMEERLRLTQNCFVMLNVDQISEPLVPLLAKINFLDHIQP